MVTGNIATNLDRGNERRSNMQARFAPTAVAIFLVELALQSSRNHQTKVMVTSNITFNVTDLLGVMFMHERQ